MINLLFNRGGEAPPAKNSSGNLQEVCSLPLRIFSKQFHYLRVLKNMKGSKMPRNPKEIQTPLFNNTIQPFRKGTLATDLQRAQEPV
jgi:hypothetical protein